MEALGALLDRVKDPFLTALGEGPELPDSHRVREASRSLEVVAVRIHHVVAELRLHADDDPILLGRAPIAQRYVLDCRCADGLHLVVPAAAREVVKPSHPLGEQLRREQLRQARPIAPVPCGLDLGEQRRCLGADIVGSEGRVILRRLGSRQLNPALALLDLAPRGGPGTLLVGGAEARCKAREHEPEEHQPAQHQRAEPVAEDRDLDQEPEQDVEDEAFAAAATATLAASSSAESSRTAARGGEVELVPGHPTASSRTGPTPGSCWATCSSA